MRVYCIGVTVLCIYAYKYIHINYIRSTHVYECECVRTETSIFRKLTFVICLYALHLMFISLFFFFIRSLIKMYTHTHAHLRVYILFSFYAIPDSVYYCIICSTAVGFFFVTLFAFPALIDVIQFKTYVRDTNQCKRTVTTQ